MVIGGRGDMFVEIQVETPVNLTKRQTELLREFEKEKMISKDDLELGEEELQKLTDRMIEETDKIGQRKDAEIMEV